MWRLHSLPLAAFVRIGNRCIIDTVRRADGPRSKYELFFFMPSLNWLHFRTISFVLSLPVFLFNSLVTHTHTHTHHTHTHTHTTHPPTPTHTHTHTHTRTKRERTKLMHHLVPSKVLLAACKTVAHVNSTKLASYAPAWFYIFFCVVT